MSTLGRYRLVRLLATGGMGEVYLARNDEGAPVVLKRVLRHLANDLTFLERFEAEAALSVHVKHSNVARVFGLERADGDVFLVQEYVHGVTLDGLRKAAQGRLPPGTAVTLVAQLLRGLSAVHEARGARGQALRVVHGDVSPQNALVGYDGRLRLVDFGAARPAGLSAERFATRAYAAPEAAANESVDARTDVFAAGRVLTELITGQPDGDALPAGLKGIIERAVAPEPADRFSTARHFAEALEAWGEGQEAAPAIAQVLRESLGARAMEPLNLDAMVLEPPPETTRRLVRSTLEGQSVGDQPALAPTKPSRAPFVIAAACALTVVGVGAGWWLRQPSAQLVVSGDAATASTVAPPDAAAATSEGPSRGLDAAVATGVLRVETLARTEVWVNGVRLGRAPLGPQTLPAGALTVVLRTPRKVKRFTLSLEPGREVRIVWPAKRRQP